MQFSGFEVGRYFVLRAKFKVSLGNYMSKRLLGSGLKRVNNSVMVNSDYKC